MNHTNYEYNKHWKMKVEKVSLSLVARRMTSLSSMNSSMTTMKMTIPIHPSVQALK
jgi:hypothetical protein